MSQRRAPYSPEFREAAVRKVLETSRPIAEVAKEVKVNSGTLGNWVAAYRREHAGEEEHLNADERARMRELERENRELRMRVEFLGKATAFFAQEYR